MYQQLSFPKEFRTKLTIKTNKKNKQKPMPEYHPQNADSLIYNILCAWIFSRLFGTFGGELCSHPYYLFFFILSDILSVLFYPFVTSLSKAHCCSFFKIITKIILWPLLLPLSQSCWVEGLCLCSSLSTLHATSSELLFQFSPALWVLCVQRRKHSKNTEFWVRILSFQILGCHSLNHSKCAFSFISQQWSISHKT